MSRTAKFIIGFGLAVIFVPPFTMAYYYSVHGYSSQESFWSGLFMTDTAWAKGCSERKFSKITIGMSREEVRRIMGDPIRGEPSGFYWAYTESPTGTHYHQRGLVFSEYGESGHVVKIVKGFYFD